MEAGHWDAKTAAAQAAAQAASLEFTKSALTGQDIVKPSDSLSPQLRAGPINPDSPSTSIGSEQRSDYSCSYATDAYNQAPTLEKPVKETGTTETGRKAAEANRMSRVPEAMIQGSIETPDPDVEHNQHLWVYDHNTKRSARAQGWTNPVPQTGEPLAITAKLISAPASFNTPCKMKKVFKPAFKLQLTASFTSSVSFNVNVKCYLLSEQQASTMEIWSPEVHCAEDGLAGHIVEETIAAEAQAGVSGTQQVVQVIEFPHMKFVMPSNMKQQYILFAIEIPSLGSLWLRYTKSTVVVSRSVDQHNKALLIIKGIQPMDGRSLRGRANAAASAAAATEAAVNALKRNAPGLDDYEPTGYYTPSVCKDYMLLRYNEAGLARSLETMELNYLMLLAGYAPLPGQSQLVNPSQHLPGDQYENFQEWYEEQVVGALKSVQHLWDRVSPYAMCSFAFTRDAIEQKLRQAPAGAFCVRPRLKRDEDTTWVISVCYMEKPAAPIVQHILLSKKHIEAHTLDVWVRDLQNCKFVLDIPTGKLLHKEDFFLSGYLRLGKDIEDEGAVPPPQQQPPQQLAAYPPPHNEAWQTGLSIPQATLDGLFQHSPSTSPIQTPAVRDVNCMRNQLYSSYAQQAQQQQGQQPPPVDQQVMNDLSHILYQF